MITGRLSSAVLERSGNTPPPQIDQMRGWAGGCGFGILRDEGCSYVSGEATNLQDRVGRIS